VNNPNETELTVITREQFTADMIAGLSTELAHVYKFLEYIGPFVPEHLKAEYMRVIEDAGSAWNVVSGVAA